MTTLVPTSEQLAIIDAGLTSPASLMITAYAGCSKTTTLSLLSWASYDAGKRQPTLYIVFNRKNKKEAEGVDRDGKPRFPPNVLIRTINGLGHSALSRALGRPLILDDRKLGKLVTSTAKSAGMRLDSSDWNCVRELVTNAMQAGLVPLSMTSYRGLILDEDSAWEQLADYPSPHLITVARKVLLESTKLGLSGTISYDDQIYLPTLFSGVFTKYPLVLLDEAQDQSNLNIMMLAKSLTEPHGRIVAVGDPKQSIYQWRGAAPDAMDQVRALRPTWLNLPLTTTFRCPKIIVARQRSHARGFRAAERNPEGEHFTFVASVRPVPNDVQPKWSWLRDIAPLANGTSCAVLCRNNGPLISLAFKLLRCGVPITMQGRDIGRGLVALSKKLLPKDDIPPEKCHRAIADWATSEIALAEANDQPSKAESARDRSSGLLAVLEATKSRTSGELRKALEDLFSREGQVVLSSIHRAKGLEWSTVLHLDPWRIPSKYARSDDALEQERNLCYVAETRAKRTLIEANLEDFAA